MKPVNQLAKAVQLTEENIPLRPPRSGNGGRCRRRLVVAGGLWWTKTISSRRYSVAVLPTTSPIDDHRCGRTWARGDGPRSNPQRRPSIGDRRRRSSLFDVRRSQRNDFRRVHVHRRSTGELTDLWSVARPHQVYACSRSAARATACSKVWTSTARRATL